MSSCHPPVPQDFFGRAALHPYILWLVLVVRIAILRCYTLFLDILNLTSSGACSSLLFNSNRKRNVSEAGKKSNAWQNPAVQLSKPAVVSRQVPWLALPDSRQGAAQRRFARPRAAPPPPANPRSSPLPPLRAEASRAAAVAAAAAAPRGAGMADGARSVLGGSPASSPVLSGRGHVSSSSSSFSSSSSAIPPGHSFRRVTLTKPTFCHYCTDFIWALAGYQCEVCNFMSHEKCLKNVNIPCSCIAPSLVRVPVAHCFGPPGHYKRKFCTVCRKSLESPAFRCEAAELRSRPPSSLMHILVGLMGVLNTVYLSFRWRYKATRASVQHSCRLYDLRGVLLKYNNCFHSGKQTLKIFDGSDAVKRNQFRLISVPRIAKNEEVVEAALRAYYINDDQQEYELQTFTQQALLSDDIINRNDAAEDSNLGSVFRESVPEAWIIRAKPKDEEVIRIYPAWLREGMAFISLRVNKDSTTQTVIKEVLPLLGRQRMVLDNQELILNRLKDIRKISIRQMNQTRFYIVENSKSTIQVNMFIGGLPPQLSPEEYMNILKDELAIKTNVVSLSHVYQAQGAVVLEISCFSEAERIYMLAKDTTVNDKPLNAVVIPEVMLHDKLVFPECCPTAFFVLHCNASFPLCFVSKWRFHMFSKVPSFRVLVCGGDGTVGWVLGALEEIRHKLVCSEPSVAILPLGTGNDLGRVLCWGAGYSGEDPYSVLISVDEADDVLMDRWTILLDAEEPAEGAENGMAEPEPPKAQDSVPGSGSSQFHNKGVYVKVGLQKISHTRNLHKDIKLQVDQREVELPNIEGLIFINIPSWGSGADLWGTDSDDRFEKPRIDDGLLEVVGVTGVVHMGQVQSGFRSGIRIAQGSYFRVTLLKPIPVQVDGEPWIQAPGQIIISAAGPKVHMLKKAKQKKKKLEA
uniref:Diacylglycerol kinase n=1 Tax=Pavo cristatus TaxID=9049 RepID=A0A8C9LC01_PAVCR